MQTHLALDIVRWPVRKHVIPEPNAERVQRTDGRSEHGILGRVGKRQMELLVGNDEIAEALLVDDAVDRCEALPHPRDIADVRTERRTAGDLLLEWRTSLEHMTQRFDAH